MYCPTLLSTNDRPWSHFVQFREILVANGANNELLIAVFEDLVRRYKELHRGHHNNRHITEFCELLRYHREKFSDYEAAVIAAEEHDSIYQLPTTENPFLHNEHLSKLLAQMHLGVLGVDFGFVQRVMRFIEITEIGVERTPDDERLFHDCDYWVLGSPEERYLEYCEGIYKEYRAKEYPQQFARARSEFLRSQLQQERIFETDEFHECYHAQATQNISAELERLS